MFRLLLLLTLLFAATDAFAKANGVDSRFTYSPIGCGSADGGAAGECHVQLANPALMVTIEGPAQIDPGGAGFYTVSIPADFNQLEGAGVNVALGSPNSTGCDLEAFSTNLRLDNELGFGDDMLTHDYEGDPPPSDLVGIWSYQFLVVNCTTPGPLLLLAAMNAFDGSGDEEGEIWNKTELTVTVPEPTAALVELGTFLTLLSLLNSRTSPIQPRRRDRA